HAPEKCEAVFRKDHAQKINLFSRGLGVVLGGLERGRAEAASAPDGADDEHDKDAESCAEIFATTAALGELRRDAQGAEHVVQRGAERTVEQRVQPWRD